MNNTKPVFPVFYRHAPRGPSSEQLLSDLRTQLRIELMEEFRFNPPKAPEPLPVVVVALEHERTAGSRDGSLVSMFTIPHRVIRPFRLVLDPDCARDWEVTSVRMGTVELLASDVPIPGIACHPLPEWLQETIRSDATFPIANLHPYAINPGVHARVGCRRLRGTAACPIAWFLAQTGEGEA